MQPQSYYRGDYDGHTVLVRCEYFDSYGGRWGWICKVMAGRYEGRELHIPVCERYGWWPVEEARA